MTRSFEIIDLFAGPGGLGEGFAAAGQEGGSDMTIRLSIEKEPTEVETLRLRAFLRGFGQDFPREYYDCLHDNRSFPDWSGRFPAEWKRAEQEARQLELGSKDAFTQVSTVLDDARERGHGDTILIGGPPCQAYSLVGRARNRGTSGYVPEEDGRHYLYREYVRVLDRLRPAAFVMENVKGMLSSSVGGGPIFERVVEDLRRAGDGYTLIPVAAPITTSEPDARDFLVYSEQHGIPQARHRVFVIGLRSDIPLPAPGTTLLHPRQKVQAVSTGDVIDDLPPLRSRLSRGDTDGTKWGDWRKAVREQADRVANHPETPEKIKRAILRILSDGLGSIRIARSTQPGNEKMAAPGDLYKWLHDKSLEVLLHHETRSHNAADLARYLFVSLYGRDHSRSPKLQDFPGFLLPDHKNARSGKFQDRFKVQLPGRASSTITSHIRKDGHYFIHHDPLQVRSFTVREAARIQTFPDNYHFCGDRRPFRNGARLHQVGNAVPPFLAYQIAKAVRNLLA